MSVQAQTCGFNQVIFSMLNHYSYLFLKILQVCRIVSLVFKEVVPLPILPVYLK